MPDLSPFWSVLVAIYAGIPAPILTALILAAAVVVALAVFGAIRIVVRHLVARRHPRLMTFLRGTRGVTRFAVVLVALAVAARLAPLSDSASATLSGLFQASFIVLLGWFAAVNMNIVADLYLLRFRIDVEDNLLARKHVTQVRVLKRAVQTLIAVITIAAALMTFQPVRQFGVSLFASAGIAGIVVGFAARPLLASLLAGVQIAMTQPIRIDDAVVIENEWGWIEEITATYVVVKLWDWRRLVVPLSYFMEKPFQNWTRETSSLIGTVLIYTDYTVPVARLREQLNEIVAQSKLWDRQVVNLQVTDARDQTVELRMLVSARNSSEAFDLRCEVREKMIDFLQREYPQVLPRVRQENFARPEAAATPLRAAHRGA